MSENELDQVHEETVPGLLLVDDEKNVLSSLRRIFRKSNCNVFIANSGQEGIDVLKEQDIDVIISDARMPEMSGPEFLAIAAEDYPDTIRILLTGYAEMEAIVDAVNLGKVSHYVEKPWDDEKLLALVEDAFIKINLKKENEALQSLVASQNQKLIESNEILEATVKERTQKIIEINGSLQENYRNTIDLFANLLEMRAPKTNKDTPDIATLVSDMGQILGLPQREHVHLIRAAKMRYMSQMGFPDDLINTPYELLSEEQKQKYEQYPLHGAALLSNIRPLVPVAEIILKHKEYLNGEGYPNREEETSISKSAQILSVANDYLELITGRMKEKPLSHDGAINYLESKAESYYAMNVIEALKSSLSTNTAKVEQHIKDQCIKSKWLVDGMALARDLKTPNGDFLLAKGTKLADSAIMILHGMETSLKQELEIFVQIPAGLEVSKELLESIEL